MIKKLIILPIALCCFFSANAQVSLGWRGGLNLSGVTNTQPLFADFEYQAGFLLGGVADIQLNDYLHIRPEVLFSSKGFKEKYVFGRNGDNVAFSNGQDKIQYLEIPVFFAYHGKLGAGELVTNIGPYLGLALAGNYKRDLYYQGVHEVYEGRFEFENKLSQTELNEAEAGVEFMKRTDYGMVAGLGYQINRFMLSGTYSFSIASINTEVERDDLYPIINKRRFKVFQLSLAYFLKRPAY